MVEPSYLTPMVVITKSYHLMEARCSLRDLRISEFHPGRSSSGTRRRRCQGGGAIRCYHEPDPMVWSKAPLNFAFECKF